MQEVCRVGGYVALFAARALTVSESAQDSFKLIQKIMLDFIHVVCYYTNMNAHYGLANHCVCCGKNYEFIPIWGKEGAWCLSCFGQSYYDGLEPRENPLSLEETRKHVYIYNKVEDFYE